MTTLLTLQAIAPIDNDLRRREFLGVLVAAGLLVGCGTDDHDAPPPDAGDGFPITLDQPGGPVSIERAPVRVVSLNSWDLELLVALGVTPVARFDFVEALPPWLRDRPELSDLASVVVSGELDPEQVLSFEPDLVVDINGFYSGVFDGSRGIRDRLGEVPVVTTPTGDSDTWADRLRHLARALGREERGEELVTQTESVLSRIREQNPVLDGAQVTFGQVDPEGNVALVVDPEDYSRRFLQSSLGLEVPSSQRQLDVAPGDQAVVSLENLEVVEAGAAMFFFGLPGSDTGLRGEPVWEQLDVVRRGAVVELTLDDVGAVRQQGPLSVSYLADELVPRLVIALNAR